MEKDYSGYVDSSYLDEQTRVLSAVKRRTYELMAVEVGHRVLDVGCGPGSDTLSLADLVGDSGEVYGVDFDPEMVDEAAKRATAADLRERVLHRQADAVALPFDDDFFDACRSERLFQHLSDPQRGLAEMIRVTRPGGRIVVLDGDYGSLSIGSAIPEVERRVVEQYRFMMNSPFAARSLYRWFKTADLDLVSFQVVPFSFDDLGVFSQTVLLDRVLREAQETGRITNDESSRFLADLERAAEIGGFFASAQFLLVSGRKQYATTNGSR